MKQSALMLASFLPDIGDRLRDAYQVAQAAEAGLTTDASSDDPELFLEQQALSSTVLTLLRVFQPGCSAPHKAPLGRALAGAPPQPR